jgi:hypothetical protein
VIVWLSLLGDPASFRRMPLAQRLLIYRYAVSEGCVADLAEGVAAMSASYARWRQQERRSQRSRFRAREGRRDEKRWRLARAKVPPGPCHYCGAPDAGTIDHVIPRTQGGTHDLANLVRCCILCNSRKNNRTPEQWRAAAALSA